MFKYSLKNGLEANIWINEVPMVIQSCKSEILVEGSTELYANTKKLIMELFIPRDHNNYALLGIDFVATNEKKVIAKININNQNQTKYKDAIALSIDTVTYGIIDEYKEGIINSIHKHVKSQTLPSGIITYNISAYAEIGSSQKMFELVSDILLSLLIHDNIDEHKALQILLISFSKPFLSSFINTIIPNQFSPK